MVLTLFNISARRRRFSDRPWLIDINHAHNKGVFDELFRWPGVGVGVTAWGMEKLAPDVQNRQYLQNG